jgi:hypothetical protein
MMCITKIGIWREIDRTLLLVSGNQGVCVWWRNCIARYDTRNMRVACDLSDTNLDKKISRARDTTKAYNAIAISLITRVRISVCVLSVGGEGRGYNAKTAGMIRMHVEFLTRIRYVLDCFFLNNLKIHFESRSSYCDIIGCLFLDRSYRQYGIMTDLLIRIITKTYHAKTTDWYE